MVMAQGGYGMPAGLDANGYVLPTGQATSGLGGSGGGGGIGNIYQSQQQLQQPPQHQQPWQPLQSQAQTYNLGFGGMNPYTQGAVNNTMNDMARNYNLINRPQQESSMVNSGSFGNSGLQQMRQNDDYNQMQNMGNVAANMQNNAYLGQQQFGLQAQNQQFNQQMANQNFDANQYWTGQNFDAGRYDTSFNQNQQQLQNYMNLMNQANGYNQQDITNTTAVQNAPMNYWSQFSNGANGIAKGYNTQTTNTQMPGSPLAGALGGWSLGTGINKALGY